MTDKELQDLIGLKKYEQPEEGYFDDFLIEFQQRQRSEMLKTSARGLLAERAKAWFSEFGSLRWVIVAGAAYAAVALGFYFITNHETSEPAMASSMIDEVKESENIISISSANEGDTGLVTTVSMVFIKPVDFSTPAPAFSTEERIY
jgi:hypothetical protein